MIAGQSMLKRVYDLAVRATQDLSDVDILIATEDQRIADHAKTFDAPCVLTPNTCQTGTDRAAAAIKVAGLHPDVVLNLQGDAPLTPSHFIRQVIDAFRSNPMPDVVTPAYKMTWEQLDDLRASKKKTPFSGTTIAVKSDGYALWFSKNIIPAIRGEDPLRHSDKLSPILKHIGLYGYKYNVLKSFINLPQSTYEVLEGLEQLRLLENGYTIKVVTIDPKGQLIHGGIDSPEDIVVAEKLLQGQ